MKIKGCSLKTLAKVPGESMPEVIYCAPERGLVFIWHGGEALTVRVFMNLEERHELVEFTVFTLPGLPGQHSTDNVVEHIEELLNNGEWVIGTMQEWLNHRIGFVDRKR